MQEQTFQNLSTDIPANIQQLQKTGKCDNCLLENANLEGLKITSLISSDLTGANLKNADLTGCQLVRTRFDNANLEGARLDNIIFNKQNASHGSRPRFNNTNLKNVSARNSSFQNVQIIYPSLDESKVDRADFSGTDFTIANIKNVDFSNTNLANTNFSYATFNNIRLPEDPNKLANIKFSSAQILNLQNCTTMPLYNAGRIAPCVKKFCNLGLNLKDVSLENTVADYCHLYP